MTGYGWGTKHLWDGFLLGESAVKLTTGLEGFVDGGQAYLSLIADEGDRRDGPSRFMQAARAAAREAISDAMERGWKPGPVVGLVHSIEAGDIETWSKFYRSGESRVRPEDLGQHAALDGHLPADEGERLPRPDHVRVGHVRNRQRRP